ncbi:hypothetical protein E8E14_003244 [Neopestalotiopsis sp. 37M]|nr:hypothetical protein E8E14_003244 [Neopestalotiopsis sp. 37M]
MKNTAETARKPNLEPIWTDYRNLSGMPKTAFKPAASPEGLPSPSPMSPKSLPSPIYPAAHNSYTTRQHEKRVMISDGFDSARSQRSSNGSSGKSLRSIDEEEEQETPLTARLERFSNNLPPLTLQFGLPSPPAGPPPTVAQLLSPQPNRDSLQRWGTVLEPKTTVSFPLQSIELSQPPGLHRRNSAVTGTRPLPPPPPPPREQSVVEIRDQLRNWGHVYHGNIETADAFVIARSLRRQSSSLVIHHARGGDSITGCSARSREGPSPSTRKTVRAIIRPKALERHSFLIQRTFDMDQLRATIPDPPPVVVSNPSSSAASPPSSSASFPHPPGGHRLQKLQEQQDRSFSGTHRRFLCPVDGSTGGCSFDKAFTNEEAEQQQQRPLGRAAGGTWQQGQHEPGPRDLDTRRQSRADPYAMAYLPVLAALLASGHVREGDVIYLPLPHPEVWPHTVRYIYTGQGDLTAAVRENISYLAGKV